MNSPSVVDKSMIHLWLNTHQHVHPLFVEMTRNLISEFDRCKDQETIELLPIKEVLDASGMSIGTEHETYTQLQRIMNLATIKDYWVRKTDDARVEVSSLKAENEKMREAAEDLKRENGELRAFPVETAPLVENDTTEIFRKILWRIATCSSTEVLAGSHDAYLELCEIMADARKALMPKPTSEILRSTDASANKKSFGE